VNTAIFSPSGASAGIGFAVPVDTVNRVVPQLIATGRYVRPVLGIRVEHQLNVALARRYGIEGVFVLDVERGSPAARAGFRPARLGSDGAFEPGDVIVAVNGRPVSRVADLLNALDRLAPGAEVTVTLMRDGRRLEMRVVLEPGR
jgi:S1-C subfamily serine protease